MYFYKNNKYAYFYNKISTFEKKYMVYIFKQILEEHKAF